MKTNKRETISMKGPAASIQGRRLVYRKDPVFDRSGWCLYCGSVVHEMQTMCWVDDIVGTPGEVGQTGIVDGLDLILDL